MSVVETLIFQLYVWRYRLLLWGFPPNTRRYAGADMLADFRRECYRAGMCADFVGMHRVWKRAVREWKDDMRNEWAVVVVGAYAATPVARFSRTNQNAFAICSMSWPV